MARAKKKSTKSARHRGKAAKKTRAKAKSRRGRKKGFRHSKATIEKIRKAAKARASKKAGGKAKAKTTRHKVKRSAKPQRHSPKYQGSALQRWNEERRKARAGGKAPSGPRRRIVRHAYASPLERALARHKRRHGRGDVPRSAFAPHYEVLSRPTHARVARGPVTGTADTPFLQRLRAKMALQKMAGGSGGGPLRLPG